MRTRHLDSAINELTNQLLVMGGYVEKALECATAGWKSRSRTQIKEVFAIEDNVNRSHVGVDKLALGLLATQQPMAVDLRFVLSCIKINNDLERMVDLTVNIANNSDFILEHSTPLALGDLEQMSEEVRIMVREVLDAFVKNDEGLARKVLSRDDRVDSYKRKIVGDTVEEIRRNPNWVDIGLNCIFIARNLERIGDHATNIAEDIVFSVSGRDIRHQDTMIHDDTSGNEKN